MEEKYTVLQYLDSARCSRGFMNMSECYAHLRQEGIVLHYFSNPDILLFLSVEFTGALALFCPTYLLLGVGFFPVMLTVMRRHAAWQQHLKQ